jgi:hypothetical protein
MPTLRERISIHEAAHATAGLVLGLPLVRASPMTAPWTVQVSVPRAVWQRKSASHSC